MHDLKNKFSEKLSTVLANTKREYDKSITEKLKQQQTELGLAKEHAITIAVQAKEKEFAHKLESEIKKVSELHLQEKERELEIQEVKFKQNLSRTIKQETDKLEFNFSKAKEALLEANSNQMKVEFKKEIQQLQDKFDLEKKHCLQENLQKQSNEFAKRMQEREESLRVEHKEAMELALSEQHKNILKDVAKDNMLKDAQLAKDRNNALLQKEQELLAKFEFEKNSLRKKIKQQVCDEERIKRHNLQKEFDNIKNNVEAEAELAKVISLRDQEKSLRAKFKLDLEQAKLTWEDAIKLENIKVWEHKQQELTGEFQEQLNKKLLEQQHDFDSKLQNALVVQAQELKNKFELEQKIIMSYSNNKSSKVSSRK